MEFYNTGDLVNRINSTLGEFCNEFGRKRKELLGLGRVPTRGILFTYDKAKNNNWAINEGGGTELQYHIFFDSEELEIRYGLGFNTQYVPFANQMSPVDYMQPYMNGFLKNERQIRQLLPDYEFVDGSIERLKNPKHNEYTLFGKTLNVEEEDDDGYSIAEDIFENIIEDLKKQFVPYQIILLEKNNFKKIAMNIQNSISVLTHKGQIILQGPPGTGKTYTAKDIAEQMLFSHISENKQKQKEFLESTERFKLIQFHPSYSYEDFVRGIVAESKVEFIEYNTKNKILAAFAKKANTNYTNSKKESTIYSKEKWIAEQFQKFIENLEDKLETEDKIKLTDNVSIFDIEIDAFRYKGEEGWTKNGNKMRFSDIKKAFFDNNLSRQDIKKNSNLSGLAHHHSSYYIRVLNLFKEYLKQNNLNFTDTKESEQLKPFVLIIDEINRANLPAVLGELIYALEYRGEKVESMYETEEDGNTIIIPPNLYIIGTMNTSDRSVGHIDYAIRRRFAFIDVLPKVLEGDNFELDLFKKVSGLFIQNFDEYVKDNTVELKLSEHLSDEFKPEEVWLGHSYFIKGEGDFSLRKNYEIVPILKEYVKDGILKQSAEKIINAL
jgi:MoxR-like ATPase